MLWGLCQHFIIKGQKWGRGLCLLSHSPWPVTYANQMTEMSQRQEQRRHWEIQGKELASLCVQQSRMPASTIMFIAGCRIASNRKQPTCNSERGKPQDTYATEYWTATKINYVLCITSWTHLTGERNQTSLKYIGYLIQLMENPKSGQSNTVDGRACQRDSSNPESLCP